MFNVLTLWCLGLSEVFVSIGLDNGLAPIRCQAIIWNNVDPYITMYVIMEFQLELSYFHSLWKLSV